MRPLARSATERSPALTNAIRLPPGENASSETSPASATSVRKPLPSALNVTSRPSATAASWPFVFAAEAGAHSAVASKTAQQNTRNGLRMEATLGPATAFATRTWTNGSAGVGTRGLAGIDRAAREHRTGRAGGIQPAGHDLVQQGLHLGIVTQR